MTVAALTASRARLWAEFLILFIGAPILMAATFGLFPLFPVIIGFALLAALLLQITTGWRWRMLLNGPVIGEWRLIALFTATTTATCLVVVFTLIPDRFLSLPLHRPDIWIVVMIFYPILSAFPQEVIYRSLFFERYGALFPSRWSAIAANGFVFGFGHLFFDNWVTIAMTGVGGAIMGWAYLRHSSLGLAWALHSLAGQILFTLGLGVFFYHGAIGAAP